MQGEAASAGRSDARRRPTMQDVAEEAGVSKGLVSMVLSGSSGPSATTRERVLAVAARLGYRGDRTAALLARRRTRILGVTLIPGNPYHGELTEEIQSAAEAAGYEVVLGSTAGALDEGHAIATLVDSRCEALLLLGPTLPAARLAALVEALPTVVLGRPVDLPDVDVVRADDVAGVGQAVDHLAGLGHRRLAHVDGGAGAIADVRREAYLTAIGRHGLDPLVLPGGLTEDEGAGALDALPERAGVTALVAFNDRTAIGLLDRLERSGVDVPRAMSVTGFDDSPLARHSRIDLTSIAQGYLEQARMAVRLALERLEGGRTERREIVVPTRLMVRGSTSPPPPDAGPAEEVTARR
jgi:DNA-binding LacI/PurR family transcriptional regulator